MILKHKKINVLGTMSGTSFDGIDLSIIETDGRKIFKCKTNYYFEYPKNITEKLLELSDTDIKSNRRNKLIKKISLKITDFYIQKILLLPEIQNIDLVGFHGQTIYHNPKIKMSIQLGDAELLSKSIKKPVIFNFRKNDLIHGGQGAPLAPIYHKYIIDNLKIKLPACFLNIGGISNITYVEKNKLIAFDTGPGNCLINDLTMLYFNKSYDKNGCIASSGKIKMKIINKILQDSYLKKTYPKSLDRQYFIQFLKNINDFGRPEDLICTISELTAITIAKSLYLLPRSPINILVSGGGAKNKFIMKRLEQHLKCKINLLKSNNFQPDFIESQLIAFLAAKSINNFPYTFPTTTGVIKPLSGGELVIPTTKNH